MIEACPAPRKEQPLSRTVCLLKKEPAVSRTHTLFVGVFLLIAAVAALFWYFPMDNISPGQTPAQQFGN
ncbi:hypothetical protein FHS20_005245 [Phyllobacterium endophyticum]|nr:hypothetical protein [Phyllobacterium endophyticum]